MPNLCADLIMDASFISSCKVRTLIVAIRILFVLGAACLLVRLVFGLLCALLLFVSLAGMVMILVSSLFRMVVVWELFLCAMLMLLM